MTNQILITKNTLLDVVQKEKNRQLFAFIFLLIVAAIALGGFLYTLSRSTVVSLMLLLLSILSAVIAVKQLIRLRKSNTGEAVQGGQFQILELPVIHKDEGRSGDVSYFELYFSAELKSFVSKKEYQRTEIGDTHYVVQVGRDNRILRTFAANQYRLAEELLPYVSQFQPEATDLI